MPVWNCSMAMKVGGQPNLRRMFQRRSRLIVSNDLSDQRRPCISLDSVTKFFLQLPGKKYVNCAMCIQKVLCMWQRWKVFVMSRPNSEQRESSQRPLVFMLLTLR